MSTEAQIKASVKYNKSRDYFGLRPDKETGKAIREAAANAGQSVQQYILQAVKYRIDRETPKIIRSYDVEPCPVCKGAGYTWNGGEPPEDVSAIEFRINHIDEVKCCDFCGGVGLKPSEN